MTLLAIEWDNRQARVAVGRAQGAGLLLEQAFTVELATAGGDEALSDDRLGGRIGAALAARQLAIPTALVAVGRASIELRPLTLPPAPDDELPLLVRNQAARQFTTLAENWPLDFVPLPAGPEEPRIVLAAAISPQLVAQIEKTCAGAGLKAERLVLRPFAAASLVRRQDRTATARVRLFVDLLAEEVDLTALVEKNVVLVRTVRLPGASRSPEQSRALVGELRRTIAAVQNELGGRKVEQVLICGDSADHAALQAQVQRDLGLKTELFDPFEQVQLGPELARRRPEHSALFAPLVGMLWDEAQNSPHAIDFAHPRKKSEPPSPWRFYTLAAAAAATVVLAVVLWAYLEVTSREDTLRALKAKGKNLEKQVVVANGQVDKLKKIDQWRSGDITWIDELADLSQGFPPAADAQVSQLQLGVYGQGGGDMLLEGRARDSNAITAFEAAFQSERRRVRPLGSKNESNDPKYPWQFRETVFVAPEHPPLAPAPVVVPAAGQGGSRPNAAGGRP